MTDLNHIDFAFLAQRFGNLCAVTALIEQDNPELEYKVSVFETSFLITVEIGNHELAMQVPKQGNEVFVQERFMELDSTWTQWEPVSSPNIYKTALHRNTDIICAVTHEFLKLVWKGIIEQQKLTKSSELDIS